MKFIKVIKSAKAEGTRVRFDSIAGSISIDLYPRDNDIKLSCWAGGKSIDNYHKEGEEDYDALVEDAKAILPELEQICSEFDNKIIALMEKHGYTQKEIK
jgi:hypothetical protein